MEEMILQDLLSNGVTSVSSLVTLLIFIVLATKRGRKWIQEPFFLKLDEFRKEFTDKLTKHGSEVSATVMRNEILMLIHCNPSDVSAIETVYSKYKADGHNSYIDRMVSDWRKRSGE